MKKNIHILFTFFLFTGIITSCRKGDTPKHFVTSIKDKTWVGTITYTNQTTEYYSVHFNTDSSFLWSQLSGDYEGKWKVNDHQLTMTFKATIDEIKADISDDDKLLNISDNSGYYEVNSGTLMVNPNMPLDDTEWLGSVYMGASKALELSFTSGLQVTVNIENSPIRKYSYTRSASGVIRATLTGGSVFFGVLTSSNEMKGNVGATIYPFQLNKQ